ncbi:hypothetical protein ACOSQ4_014251 [Xanthoceras sorbifolium]
MGLTLLSGDSTNSEPHLLLIGWCSKERTKLIHSVNLAERGWKKLLSEESLRPSRLWSRVGLNAESAPFPRFKDLIAWVQQGFELFCGTQFLIPISEVERKFASNSMSNLKVTIPTAKDVLKKGREIVAASAQKRKQPSVANIFTSPQALIQPQSTSSLTPELATSKHAKKKKKHAELKKKKVEHESQAKMEELEKKVAELLVNEDRLRIEHKAELDTWSSG